MVEQKRHNLLKKNVFSKGYSDRYYPTLFGEGKPDEVTIPVPKNIYPKLSVTALKSQGVVEQGRSILNDPDDSLRDETGVCVARGLNHARKDKECEDFVLVREGVGEYDVYGVFDGCGGKDTAEEDSAAVAVQIDEFLRGKLGEYDDPKELMVDALTHANEVLIQWYVKEHGITREDFGKAPHLPNIKETPATTATVVMVDQNSITVAHVGDSRLYLIRGNGEVYQATQDDPVSGGENVMGVDTEELELSKRVWTEAFDPNKDAFVLVTDGIPHAISEVIGMEPEEYLAGMLRKYPDVPQQFCTELVKGVEGAVEGNNKLTKKYGDDFSIVVRYPQKT